MWRFPKALVVGPLLAVASLSLPACVPDTQQPNWYEDRCLRYGFKRGSEEFEACVARDRKWIADERARATRPAAADGGGP